MGHVDLFSVLFFEGSKKRWYGAGNHPNPEYNRWAYEFDVTGPEPPSRIKSDVGSRGGFDLKVFMGLDSQVDRLEYLRGTSMFLGSGSSRVVFAVSPRRVIKLAGGSRLDAGGVDNPSSRMTEAGIYQNRREYELWERNGRTDGVGRLLPQSFDISDDGAWLLAELVRPLRDGDELREMIGLDGDDFLRLMRVLGEHGHMNSEYFKNFVLGIREKVDDVSLDDNEREGSRRGLEFVLLLHRLKELDPGLSLAELVDSSAWGKGSDGRLVLLDPGADETLMKRYYGG